VREKYCWLAGAGDRCWFGVREKYCWLVLVNLFIAIAQRKYKIVLMHQASLRTYIYVAVALAI